MIIHQFRLTCGVFSRFGSQIRIGARHPTRDHWGKYSGAPGSCFRWKSFGETFFTRSRRLVNRFWCSMTFLKVQHLLLTFSQTPIVRLCSTPVALFDSCSTLFDSCSTPNGARMGPQLFSWAVKVAQIEKEWCSVSILEIDRAKKDITGYVSRYVRLLVD